tara:strand:+ start:73271 stop:74617 length:1347 start_codon:yes stop_codon:yes gene_type:complete
MNASRLKQTFKRRYFLALGAIFVLVTLAQGYVQYELSRLESDSGIINLAGRQRMLSQKITKLYFLLKYSPERNDQYILEMGKAKNEFNTAHARLFDDSKRDSMSQLNSSEILEKVPELEAAYRKLDRITSCYNMEECETTSSQQVNLASNEFLGRMHEIVNLYEAESRRNAEIMSVAEWILYFVAIFVLVLEAKFIFSPMTRKIEEYFNSAIHEKEINAKNEGFVLAGRVNSAITHELQNSIMAMRGYSRSLVRKSKESVVVEKAQRIMELAEKCQTTIDNVRKVVRGDALNYEEVEAKTLVNRFEEFAIEYSSSDVDFTLSDRVEGVLYCNSAAIQQVFENLFRNACQAISDQRDKWINAEFTANESFFTLTLTDCGRGIPKDIQDRLFEPLFTTKGEQDGTGLGLDICKGIIEKDHGGKIFYNPESENTQFVVHIPVKENLNLKSA